MTNTYILAYTGVTVARTLKDPSHFFPDDTYIYVYVVLHGDTYTYIRIVLHSVSVVERPYSILCIFNIMTYVD